MEMVKEVKAEVLYDCSNDLEQPAPPTRKRQILHWGDANQMKSEEVDPTPSSAKRVKKEPEEVKEEPIGSGVEQNNDDSASLNSCRTQESDSSDTQAQRVYGNGQPNLVSLASVTLAVTSSGKHLCTVCNKSFASKSSLKTHIRIHTGERPYSCNVCNASFNRNHHLSQHKKIHTDQPGYKCLLCGVNARNPSDLKRHLLIVHEGSRNYRCGNCKKPFDTLEPLNSHKESCKSKENTKEATKSKPRKKIHKCDICSKLFGCPSHVIEHKRIHTGEKPYACDVCGTSFRVFSTLKMHRTIHLGDEQKTIVAEAIKKMKVSTEN